MRKNKVFMLLLSFVVAVALWLYVVTNVSKGDDAPLNNLPVVLMNQESLKERGLMLISGENTSVSLQLYGNRSDLWKLTRDNVNVTADLSSIMEAGVYELRYTATFPDGVDVEVKQSSPARVRVEIAEYAEKDVPVVLNYIGTMADDLLLDKENAELDYESIVVSGPKEVVDQISKATIDIDRSDLRETLDMSCRYTLVNDNDEPVDAALITTNTEEVHLRLPVEHRKEIPLEVELVDGGGATAATTKVDIEPATIIISGSEEALAQIDKLVLAKIDLSIVEKAMSADYDIPIPETVTNRSGVTAAKVSLSFLDLATKTFTLENFQAVNLPAGLEPTVITQQVKVTVRGPKDSINAVSQSDIIATVDYTGQDAGTVTVPLTISVRNRADVGAVGKYSISVTLAPPTEPEEE